MLTTLLTSASLQDSRYFSTEEESTANETREER